jgi:hypothetical protein
VIGTTSSGAITEKNGSARCALSSPMVSVTIRDTPNGSTQFARMPCGAPSMATTFISPTMPALAAA